MFLEEDMAAPASDDATTTPVVEETPATEEAPASEETHEETEAPAAEGSQM